MNRSHVTLPQILVAASTRHANMVPESAAYLVLALCDAIGCLPIAVADADIQLSAEGVITVAEKGNVQQAPEAARGMRDLFARLLAVTNGAAPRLAGVARARDVSAERGVDAFANEVEASLVPMNRSAGKRSLGRLARETLRAIESGALALHLQARAAAKEAPAAAAAIAPLLAAPIMPMPLRMHQALTMITPPPSMLKEELTAVSFPFSQYVTPTTPGLGLDTVATEAPVDSSIFGATPTFREGQDVSVEAANPSGAMTYESPGFDSTNTRTTSCDPTQLSAREVKIDSAPRTPSSELTMKIVSTHRRVRRPDTVKTPAEITLTSAGVEPRDDITIHTPAPSTPEGVEAEFVAKQQAILNQVLPDFVDCHDGQTQSQPKYNETLPGLAPVVLNAVRGKDDAEPLHSFEYQLYTPSALPTTTLAEALNEEVVIADHATEMAKESEEAVLSARLLQTEPPLMVVEQSVSREHDAMDHSPIGFLALDNPSDPPGRVDELLGTFGRPEEGEEEMLRKTASSLKEMAGLEPTPYAPEVSPAIRVPVMTKKATPAWLPEDSRNAPTLEPAPLVRSSRGLRARLAIPLALFIALFAGFAVVHFRLPDVVYRWMNPTEAKRPNQGPTHAATDERDVYEQQ